MEARDSGTGRQIDGLFGQSREKAVTFTVPRSVFLSGKWTEPGERGKETDAEPAGGPDVIHTALSFRATLGEKDIPTSGATSARSPLTHCETPVTAKSS